MSYNVVLFSDASVVLRYGGIPTRVTGAYKIASHLRNNGHSAIVVGNISYLLDKHLTELHTYLKKIITSDTLVVGFSLTFMGFTDSLPGIGDLRMHPGNKKFIYFIRHIKSFFPHVKIILGGSSYIGEELFNKSKLIDNWIKGFGETAIIKYLDVVKEERYLNNKKKVHLSADKQKFLNTQIIEYDILGNQYDFHNQPNLFDKNHDVILKNEILPIELSRGCRFKCAMCRHPLLGKNPHDQSYIRSQYSMAKEFEYNYKHFGTTYYNILCDTFNETTDKLLTVKRALDDVGVKINFACYLRLDLLYAHKEQIDILKEIGIKGAQFGIETFNKPTAKVIGKGMSKQRNLDALHLLREKWGDDVFIASGFVIGLPHETKESANEWLRMLVEKETPLHNFMFYALEIQKNNSTAWNSSIGRNPEKYGYTLSDRGGMPYFNKEYGGWSSSYDISTWEEASEIAEYWMSKWHEEAASMSSWGAVGLLSHGWTWAEILEYNNSPTDAMIQRIKESSARQLEEYAKNIFNKDPNNGGAGGIRTHDFFRAREALSR
jgi:radical SAM superfamily enzyme YgiQ (UPF0313 family)